VGAFFLDAARLGRHPLQRAAEVAQQRALGLAELVARLALSVAGPAREPIHLLVLTHAQLLVDLLPAGNDVCRERLADLAQAIQPTAQLGVVGLHLARHRLLNDALFGALVVAAVVEAPHQPLVAVILDGGQEVLFRLLERAGREHDEDAHHQREQRGVEGHRQARGHAADRVLHHLEIDGPAHRLGEPAHRRADADHRADEAQNRNGPDEDAHHRVAGLDGVGVRLSLGGELVHHLAGVASRLEMVQRAAHPLHQRVAGRGGGQLVEVRGEGARVVGGDAFGDAQGQQVELEYLALAGDQPVLEQQQNRRPDREEGDDVRHPAARAEELAHVGAGEGKHHGAVEQQRGHGGDRTGHAQAQIRGSAGAAIFSGFGVGQGDPRAAEYPTASVVERRMGPLARKFSF
jgi:hypothetical protein